MNVMMNSTMNSVVFTLTSPNMPEKMSTINTEETSPPMNCHGLVTYVTKYVLIAL